MPHCHHPGGEVNSQGMKIRVGAGYVVWRVAGVQRKWGLLDLAGCGGGCLAAHAGGVDRFGGDQIQVLVVRDLV